MLHPNIRFVSASAGSGKTHELMDVLHKEVSDHTPPENVMAVTHMKRAAAELSMRVRQKLIEENKPELAIAMDAARIGTVDSVCAGLLCQFAYEAGESPTQRVLDEKEGQKLFNQILKDIMDEKKEKELNHIATIFGRDVNDITDDILNLTNTARQNNINSDGLISAVTGSIAQIGRAFPKTVPKACSGLKSALELYFKKYPEPPDTTKKTANCHETAKTFLRELGRGLVPWEKYLELALIDPAVKSEVIFKDIIESAGEVFNSVALHKDIESAINFVHKTAAETLMRFEKLKTELGVVDFKDMEQKTYALLGKEEVKVRLRDELKLLLVDEFQDTSPVQLGIYLRLTQLCEKAVWVGDAKQSILGFTGADLTLMKAVMKEIGGASPKILNKSWRSKKEIVDFTSELFVKVFEQDGIPSNQIKLEAGRVDLKSDLPPLSVWKIGGKNLDANWQALAKTIQDLLKAGHKVTDRTTGILRPLQSGDIAVLAPKNDWCKKIASTIRMTGLDASYASGDLMKEPEVNLAMAAYRYIIDGWDRLAASEVEVLRGANREEWLKKALEGSDPTTWSHTLEQINSLREQILEATPSELLDLVISAAGIESAMERFENGSERVFNLAALRGLATEYENSCAETFSPCTPLGFLTYANSLEGTEGGRRPAWPRPGAVEVLTHWKSKGLEWPVVIAVGLDRPLNHIPDLFALRSVDAEGLKFDITDPLKGRSVRYMPKPFGAKKKIDVVENLMAKDEEVKALRAELRAEWRRIIYVVLTRAREALIIGVTDDAPDIDTYFGCLAGADEKIPLVFPKKKGDELIAGGKKFICDYRDLPVEELTPEKKTKARLLPEPGDVRTRFPPLFLAASQLEIIGSGGSDDSVGSGGSVGPGSSVGSASSADSIGSIGSEEKVSLGRVIELGGTLIATADVDDEIFGSAVHTFLGADDLNLSGSERLSLAGQVLKQWNVETACSADDLVQASNRFWKAALNTWGGYKAHREWPVSVKIKETFCRGSTDLALEDEKEIVIIDHKTTSISAAALTVRAKAHAPQLAVYCSAATVATGKIASAWLHFPRAGLLAEVVFNPEKILAAALKR